LTCCLVHTSLASAGWRHFAAYPKLGFCKRLTIVVDHYISSVAL